jgi:hypothetical protein
MNTEPFACVLNAVLQVVEKGTAVSWVREASDEQQAALRNMLGLTEWSKAHASLLHGEAPLVQEAHHRLPQHQPGLSCDESLGRSPDWNKYSMLVIYGLLGLGAGALLAGVYLEVRHARAATPVEQPGKALPDAHGPQEDQQLQPHLQRGPAHPLSSKNKAPSTNLFIISGGGFLIALGALLVSRNHGRPPSLG